MSIQTLPQEVVVDAVKGDVYAIGRDGNIRIVDRGETLLPGEVIITINGSSLDVVANGSLFLVDENCFACIPEPKLGQENQDVVTAQIDGKVSVDPTVTTDFDADDVAAIQQAILEGADPTAILEATAAGPAAGGGASGSANAGFVTIEYNNPEVLASTFFETTASFDNTDLNDDLNGFDITILADGGQSLSSELTEGSISLSSYPQSVTSKVIIDAADLPLDPNSFVPEPASLASLLEELNADITSGGEPVSFVFDTEQNAIIGTQDGQDVIRIDIEAISVGRDVQLEVVTTINQGIDHVPSVADGLVSFDNDQIQIAFDITGSDIGGNSILSPIDIVTTIADGDNPSVQNITIENVESSSAIIDGRFVDIGSDKIATATFDQESLAQFDGLLSDSLTTIASLSDDGSRITLSIADTNDVVLTISLNTDGAYQFEQFKPLQHDGQTEEILLTLPTTTVDFDQDAENSTFTIKIIDDQLDIVDVDALRVDENDIANVGSEQDAPAFAMGQITTSQDSDGAAQYRLDGSSNPVDGLTSHGAVITLLESDNPDGGFTYSATANGETVFTFVVNRDGTYNFTLQGPIDHAIDSDELTINFPVVVTDFDGDTAVATIPVTVDDDAPTISGVEALLVDEDDISLIGSEQNDSATVQGKFTTVSGSDGVASYELEDTVSVVRGLTSHGDSVTLVSALNADGSYTYSATANGAAVFELTLQLNGEYAFTLQGPIDHAEGSDSLQLNFPIVATDFDGDTTTSTIPVTIVDDKPSITNVVALEVDEDGLNTASSNTLIAEGQFTTTQGSDKVISYQLEVGSDPVSGLTSQGQPITLTEVSNSDGSFTYIATANGNQVFTLNVSPEGSYNFKLESQIDHEPNSGRLTIEFPIVATDFDGDTTTAIIPVQIIDDAPIIDDVIPLNVSEDDLPNIGSDENESVYVEGRFTTDQGADQVVSYQLDSSTNPVDGLTSQGNAVTLQESENQDGSFTYIATADGNPIFIMNVNVDGSYDFKLEGPIDHPSGIDALTLDFSIIATDFDGDTTTATIPVTISDDKPVLDGLIDGSVTKIDEDNIQTIGSEGSSQLNSVKGNFNAIDGSDGVVEYQVTDLNSPVKDLTSGGQDLVLVEVSNSNGVAVYEARIDGTATPVFRITLDASDDSYQFDLFAPLDHAMADGENELVINLPIQATDYDGDVSNVQTLPITVVDDVPTIGGVTPSSELTVDEDDLPKGSDEASPQDTLIGGTLDITEGADQVVSIQLNNLESPVNGLTSGGDAIMLILASSSGGVNVYQGVAGTPQAVVFELTLDARDNSYQFDLKKPLDHPDGDTENQITLELPVTATDKDGDESPEYSLAIKVVDDVPAVTAVDTLGVNEDDLSQGSDPSKEPRVDSGQFDVTSADGIDSFELDLTPGKIPMLTSGGDEVSIALDTSASSAISLVYVGETAGGETIFTLTLHQDGRYDFELSGPLDHAVGSDEILLNLPIIITDGDKDATITATLPVKIADDKPALDGLIDGSMTKIDEDDIQTIGSEGSSQLNTINCKSCSAINIKYLMQNELVRIQYRPIWTTVRRFGAR
ncbi:COG2931 [Vibrio sp. B1REV9]|nr:COG2931 [Vibrio sp. B1REV9]